MAEYKIVIAGPMGSGKTTALAAVSEIPPVRTEVRNSGGDECDKATTTVAMDFGQVRLGEGEVLRLYGTPGQVRFAFMRDILLANALGVVLLVDAARRDPLADLDAFMDSLGLPREDLAVVVGVTKLDRIEQPDSALAALRARLGARDCLLPCFRCDVRERGQVLALLDALLAVIEAGGQSAPA